MRALIMGAPGSGKGTQCALIRERLGIVTVSTGDMFRANIAEKTQLGLQVERIISAGGYVPDEITNQVVADRLEKPDVSWGFVLDGYPRTLDQVNFLETFLRQKNKALDVVFNIKVDKKSLLERLSERANCLERSDDTEDTIVYRLEKYVQETLPLLEIYRNKGLLHDIDGNGTVEEVSKSILKVLRNIKN